MKNKYIKFLKVSKNDKDGRVIFLNKDKIVCVEENDMCHKNTILIFTIDYPEPWKVFGSIESIMEKLEE